ncbi:hypothetical protein [Salinibacter ruber]|uniref:hypothetical protein n=1 Tax=Salinibacter ruber TaxID=146919 RepID=UPI002169F45B|nr:hypothetical protein [Salinibacter ruber]MCS4054461.1 hypothetical protein [Salinibacter ruber]
MKTREANYLSKGTLVPSEAHLAKLVKKKSNFMVATNGLGKERLFGKEHLEAYKWQANWNAASVFLKGPRFVASSVFLESERRIMVLLLATMLCLLGYAALK